MHAASGIHYITFVDLYLKINRLCTTSAKLLIKNMHDTSDKPEEIEIEVLDVSKTGVGFICNTPLTIGAVYETLLKIWNDDEIHAFLKIVRIEQTEDEKYMCGTTKEPFSFLPLGACLLHLTSLATS